MSARAGNANGWQQEQQVCGRKPKDPSSCNPPQLPVFSHAPQIKVMRTKATKNNRRIQENETKEIVN